MVSDTDLTEATQFYSHNVTLAVAMYKMRGHNFEFINFLELNYKIVLTSTKTIR